MLMPWQMGVPGQENMKVAADRPELGAGPNTTLTYGARLDSGRGLLPDLGHMG